MLSIHNLHAKVADADTNILQGLDIQVNAGEVPRHYGAQRLGQKYLIQCTLWA